MQKLNAIIDTYNKVLSVTHTLSTASSSAYLGTRRDGSSLAGFRAVVSRDHTCTLSLKYTSEFYI